VSEQVVEDVGVERGLFRELGAELVAPDHLAVLLVLGEVEVDLLPLVPVELPSVLLVLLDPPAIAREGIGVAVDEMTDNRHLSVATHDGKHLCEDATFTHLLDVRVGIASAAASKLELVGLTDIEHELRVHDFVLSFCNIVLANVVAWVSSAVGLSLYGFATAENVLQIRHFLLWQNSQADIQRTGVYYTTKTAILSIAAGNVQAHMAVFPRLGK